MRARVIDLSTLSMVGGSGIAESKIGLWWADGTVLPTLTNITSAGMNFLSDGSSSFATTTSSSTSLFTLSSNWPSLKFAFEATIYIGNSSYVGSASLWDMTSNSIIGATVTTSLTTETVIRSAQFTLTAGHKYGVTVWTSGGAGAAISDASLIIFP